MGFLQDIHHRINQALAASGGRVVMPDQWADIDIAAEEIDRQTCRLNGAFDSLPITRAVAGEMMRALRAAETVEYDCRWAPEFDLDPRAATADRYYALPYGSTALVPLRDWSQWVEVADTYFPIPRCDAHVDAECYRTLDRTKERHKLPVAEPIAVARGEIICIFCICQQCATGLGVLTFEDWPEYSGPFLEPDGGPAWFDPANPTALPDISSGRSNGRIDPNDPWGV